MKKYRLLSILCMAMAVVCLLLLADPTEVAAATEVASGTCGADGDNLTWTLDDEGTLTISGTGAMKNWSNGWTSNPAPWYSYSDSIKTVIIESGVTTIGNSAFYYCRSLTSVTIPDSVTEIVSDAFKDCEKLTTFNMLNCMPTIADDAFENTAWYNAQPNGILYLGKNVYKIKGTAPSSVTIKYGTLSINKSAFSSCTNLTSVTIPNSVITIGNSAFYYCTGLTSVTIPDSVTTIGEQVFYDCKSLTSVNGGDSVCSVGKYAFKNTAWFNNQPDGLVYIGKTAYEYKGTCPAAVTVKEGTLCIGDQAFYRCTDMTSVTIPDSVTTIGNSAFYYCTGLTSVTIPDSVTTIGDSAFYHCTGLTSVTIPDSVTTIGDSAFYYCTGLTSVTIPNSVTTIGSGAFNSCNKLTTVNIGSSLHTIGEKAFGGCKNLVNIQIDKDNKLYSCDDRGVLFNKSKSHIVFLLGNITGEYVIPNSVITIGNDAFYNCTGLTSVTIPDSVTTIGDSAFYNCTGLTSVTIPNSVTTIGKSAFYNCTGLTSVTIGENVISIGASAFCRCTRLTEIRFNASAMDDLSSNSRDNDVFSFAGQNGTGINVIVGTQVNRIPNYLFSPNSSEPTYAPKIISVEFEKGGVCKYIGDFAFYQCSKLTSVANGENITSIGKSAFCNCTGLTSVTIPAGVTTIGNSAFSGCTGLTEIRFNAVNMDDLASDNYVFSSAGQQGAGIKVIVGKEATKLPAYLFCPRSISSGVPKLVSIEFEEENRCKSIGDAAFYGCIDLASIDIPDNVTQIGENAFHGTTWYNNQSDGLLYAGKVAYVYKGNCPETVVIEAGTLGIGASAFYNCSGLTSVTIPESVADIGVSAFSGCTGLTEIRFNAANVSDYDNSGGAFASAGKNGTGIKLTIGAQVRRIPAYMFGYSSAKITTIEFEADSKCASIGQYAFYNCDNLSSITIPDSIQEIEAYAFNECGSLYTIKLPQKAICIRPYAFHLTGYYMQYYKGSLVVIDNHLVYLSSSAIGSWKLPEGLITIADDAALSSKIGAVELPEGLKRIGDRAFAGCGQLDEISIPESVEYIGAGAFSSTSIQSIHIPAATVFLGEDFVIRGRTETTKGIKEITVAEGNPVYHSFEGSLIETKSKTLLIGGNGIPGDGSVTIIDDGAFVLFEASRLTIPEGVVCIGSGAFSGSKMTVVYLPASVTEIREGAFGGCTQIRYVYYAADKAAWDALMEKEPHEYLMNANIHFAIEPDMELEHKYTHITTLPEGYTGIYNAEDLYNIRNDLSGKYILMNDIVFKDEDFQEGGICNSGFGWLPMGASAEAPFTGIIDGNGYTIHGLYIDYSLVENIEAGPYVGLVGYNAGVICNLGIISGTITNATGPVYRDLYVGGIAGYNVGTIENCFNNAQVSGSSNNTYTDTGVYVGGIVGYSDIEGSVVNCRNYGAVSASGFGSNTSSAAACAAGIAGYARSVSKCVNYGNITASNSIINTSVAAGIVAYGSTVTECTNIGHVKAAQAAGISYSATNISRCFNSGNIRAEGENGVSAGGIAIKSAVVTSCGNIGNVSAAASVWEVSGSGMEAYAGGIITTTDKQISDCFNAGTVSAYSGNGGNSITYAGGIAAKYYAAKMVNCYNIGEVSINPNAYYKYIGDLAGYGGFDATGCVYTGSGAAGYGSSVNNAVQSDLESMKDRARFAGFDFEAVWTMDNSAEYPYPTIQGLDMDSSVKLLGIAIAEYPQKLKYAQGDPLDLNGLKVCAYYNDGASQYVTNYQVAGDTSTPGKNRITVDYLGATATFDIDVEAFSWDAAVIGGYVKLSKDTVANVSLNADLYIDLNGFDLSGTVVTNGYKIYGMDSTTDGYTCEAIGYMNLVDENGNEIVPEAHFMSDITGSSKRYMAIKDENGYSFHRFFLGVTHMSLKPSSTGVGYKAVFYGDDMVADALDSFGFTMQLEGYDPITVYMSADKFVSGKVITLRIDNYDVEHFGETGLSAKVMLQLTDGTVIESRAATMTFRGLMEQLNTGSDAFTADQLAAIAAMIEKHAIIKQWDTDNLYK